MSEKRETGLGNFLKVGSGLIVGLATGVAAGLLFAPKKGTETIEDLKNFSSNVKDNTESKFNELKELSEEKIAEFKDFSETKIEEVKTISEETLHNIKSKGEEMLDQNQAIPTPIEELPLESLTIEVEKANDNIEDLSDLFSSQMENVEVAPEVEEAPKRVMQSGDDFDDSTESLLARIQGVTAENLED